MEPVAVTSYPTGIAHSQMMAENFLQADERLGHGINAEVQGAMGTQDELAFDAIAKVDAVTITSDTSVSRDRFDGKLVLKGTARDGANNAEAVVQKAVELTEAGRTGSVTFGGGDDGEDADVGTDDLSNDVNAVELDEPVCRGGDLRKGLFVHLRKLFS